VGVPVGSRIQLDLPAEYAFGESGPVPGALRCFVDVISAE
jgi:hypothetical protein